MRRILIIATLLLFTIGASAQQRPSSQKSRDKILGEMEQFVNVADILPDDVSVEGTTQGFAIHGRYGFSVHDRGQCVIIDLKRRSFVSTFVMEGNTGHCNNASFGVERYDKSSQFPLLYVTECRGNRACYVNDISLTGSRLVQTIYYDGEEITGPADWFVDAPSKRIFLYCTIGNLRWIKAFRLPKLADSDSRGEVHLRPEDSIGSLPAGDISIPQGSHLYSRYIFLPAGVPSRSTALHITDALTAEHYPTLDLSPMGLEPEGVATRRGWLYVSFHTPRDNRANVIFRMKVN